MPFERHDCIRYTARVMSRKLALAIAVLSALLTAPAVISLEVDTAELEQGIGDADINFDSYEGPVDQIDSAAAIRGIGGVIGRRIGDTLSADYFGRYRVQRIIGTPDGSLRSADIVELDARARVDHIRNLRRIIAGYLEGAWAYSPDDADLLARFITIYNAVHRGNLPFFETRYRDEVVAALDATRVGLAISYSEWPGRTQIVIPIRVDRVAGDLDAVDPGQLIDAEVIRQLRTRTDLGIDDRKAIIDFIERVIEQRQEAIDAERVEIAEEREEIAAARDEVAPDGGGAATEPDDADEPAPPEQPERDQPAPEAADDEQEAPAAADDERPVAEAAPPEEPADEPTAAPPEADTAEELDEREAELDAREAELDQQQAEVDELTEQVEELYQETAADQAAGIPSRDPVPFVLVTAGGALELAIVNRSDGELLGDQTIPLDDRTVLTYQGNLLVRHAGSGRLLLLDAELLEIIAESEAPVVAGSDIEIVGQRILAVVSVEGGTWIGEFDSQLVLVRRSGAQVRARTDIVSDGEDGLLVQGADGTVRSVPLEDL